MTGAAALTLHASCVALGARGVLILGPSGSGKSALALQLMALGAALVADDRTEVQRSGAGLVARCPATLSGLIEARGVGLLRADPLDHAVLDLAVDLGQRETDRLPPERGLDILGVTLPLVHGQETSHFPAAILQYLKSGRAG